MSETAAVSSVTLFVPLRYYLCLEIVSCEDGRALVVLDKVPQTVVANIAELQQVVDQVLDREFEFPIVEPKTALVETKES